MTVYNTLWSESEARRWASFYEASGYVVTSLAPLSTGQGWRIAMEYRPA